MQASVQLEIVFFLIVQFHVALSYDCAVALIIHQGRAMGHIIDVL